MSLNEKAFFGGKYFEPPFNSAFLCIQYVILSFESVDIIIGAVDLIALLQGILNDYHLRAYLAVISQVIYYICG